ncbi:hypothetical protein BCT27_10100 [Enterovibrio norvegicus]|nr:hypothetical protein BCT27_10100 [Enterovibrio norvegicus]
MIKRIGKGLMHIVYAFSVMFCLYLVWVMGYSIVLGITDSKGFAVCVSLYASYRLIKYAY